MPLDILLFLVIGILIGAIMSWFIAKYKYASMNSTLNSEELQRQYVRKEVYHKLQEQTDMYRADMMEKERELRSIAQSFSASEADNRHLKMQLEKEAIRLQNIQREMQLSFEQTANRIFEEKGKNFSHHNQEQLAQLLVPLRQKINDFEQGIERRYLEKTRDMVSLKKEIEQLKDLNLQLSQDANNLAHAIKGDNKTQGDWGELQLELLLEKSGLVKDIHFKTQVSYKDTNGRIKRPDFIINLPEQKHLVIDSKVSLVSYERYCSDEAQQALHLKKHLESLRRHISDLASKNYQHLYQISSPDYVLLFVPIEPAFTLAVQSDDQLFLDALDKNIVLVTTSTLLATMRTVSYIWKQEKQKKSVLEIARQSGLLYDKLCNFVNDLKQVGHKLDQAQNSYHAAMNKLSDSKKYGDTLLGRAEKIKALGAKNSKEMPKNLFGD